MLERLQKFISGAGIASRRHAEEMILAGRVKVNGKIVKELGTKVDTAKDAVLVDGKKISKQKFVYLVLNKPKKYVTTRMDPRKRKTVFDLLPPELKNVVWPVGRLDYNTEGLLVFTNDGELTQILTHPSKEHEKEYEVELDKEISEGKLEKIKTGIMLDGRMTSPAKARVAGNTVYLTIHEGWNRQIRRMFAVIGLNVRHLKRIRIGKLKLKDLQLGQYKLIDKSEII
jgi:23S rRNA pseudouridine2605 synthase